MSQILQDHEPSRSADDQPKPNIFAQIRDYVEPYLSAIAAVEPGDERDPPGTHIGTGAFINLSGLRYLLTCDHVARGRPEATLGCDLFELGGALRVANPFVSDPFPADVAVSPISDTSWAQAPHRAKCLTRDDFAQSHNPVDNEYLYVAGYPGDWAYAYPESSHTVQLAELFTAELPYDPAIDTEYQMPVEGYHIFLDCNPEHVKPLHSHHSWVAKSGGISGSLVWNTRYKEVTAQGSEWKPTDLRVTALIWGHSSKAGVFVATPVQRFRGFLNRF